MSDGRTFPTLAKVEKANVEQLARWYRFYAADTAEERKIANRIAVRLKEKGGITPALSAKIGFGGV